MKKGEGSLRILVAIVLVVVVGAGRFSCSTLGLKSAIGRWFER